MFYYRAYLLYPYEEAGPGLTTAGASLSPLGLNHCGVYGNRTRGVREIVEYVTPTPILLKLNRGRRHLPPYIIDLLTCYNYKRLSI